jgi:DNA-binding NarL/FixJ family response regulator
MTKREDLRLQGDTGSKTGGDQSEKRNKKRALVLLYLDGNNYQEIAEVLGISETNVATKISRLKSKMKQEFRGTGQTESQAKSRSKT